MSNLSSALQQLRQEHKQAEQQSGEVTVGDFGSRRTSGTKRFESLAQRRQTRLCHIGGRTQANGTGAKSTVGKSSARVEAVGWENQQFVTCEAHDVGRCQKKNRSSSTGAVGEVLKLRRRRRRAGSGYCVVPKARDDSQTALSLPTPEKPSAARDRCQHRARGDYFFLEREFSP
jgi:hypothetical protein